MSTKSSIKWDERFHLYEDVMDQFSMDHSETPIYLRLQGVQFEASNEEITVTIPRDIAIKLGLVAAKESP